MGKGDKAVYPDTPYVAACCELYGAIKRTWRDGGGERETVDAIGAVSQGRERGREREERERGRQGGREGEKGREWRREVSVERGKGVSGGWGKKKYCSTAAGVEALLW